MTLKEKIERTKEILKFTPKNEGRLIDARRHFPLFVVRQDGSVVYFYRPREVEGKPWYVEYLENFRK